MPHFVIATRTKLRNRLNALVANQDVVARREADPVAYVHHYNSPAHQEIVGLLASSLAFGNIVAAQRSISRVLDALGDDPTASLDRRRLRRRLDGFVHRVYRGEHVATLLSRAGRIQSEAGSLGAAFAGHLERAGELREGLARFADDLRGPRADRGLSHLVANPRAGSACKRLLLYLRWMVRPADGVDVGIWPVSPASLIIPVDTHILRISRNLRLTERKDASWRTAEEITATLRSFDPADPVKYDFALCHMGVSRACPSRRDVDACATCTLRPVCRHWET